MRQLRKQRNDAGHSVHAAGDVGERQAEVVTHGLPGSLLSTPDHSQVHSQPSVGQNHRPRPCSGDEPAAWTPCGQQWFPRVIPGEDEVRRL